MNNSILSKISHKLETLDGHTKEVINKSIITAFIRVGGNLIGLFLSIALANILGSEGIGIINLTNRISNIVIVFALLGMRQVIVKEVAIARVKKNEQHTIDTIFTSLIINGASAIILSILLIIFSKYLSNEVYEEPKMFFPLILIALTLGPQIVSRVISGGLIGYRKIWQSNLVEQSLSTAITAFILLIYWIYKESVSLDDIAIMYAVGRIFVTISIFIYWLSLNKMRVKGNIIVDKLLKPAKSLFWVSMSTIVIANADALILGYLTNAKEVGYYTIAARIALLTGFFLQISNSALAPKVAGLYSENKVIELENMIQKITKYLFFFGLLFLVIFIFFGRTILGLWGEEFKNAYWLLVILGIGQFVNVSTGAVSVILIMTGNEKVNSKICILMMILNLILLLLLTKFLGTIGAVIASSLTVIIQNVLIAGYVKKLTGIITIPYFNRSS